MTQGQKKYQAKKVAEIMTKNVITVKRNTTIKEAIQLCISHEISGLIVVDDKENAIGVITEKDLLVAFDYLNDAEAVINDFVAEDILSVTKDADLEDVVKMIIQRNVKRVPVLENDRVIGILSRRDVLRLII